MHVAMHVLVDMNKWQEEVVAENDNNNMEQITFLWSNFYFIYHLPGPWSL